MYKKRAGNILLILTIISFIHVDLIHAQNVTLGGGISLPFMSKNLNTGVGLDILGECWLMNDISLRFSSSFILSSANNKNKFFISTTYTQAGFEGNLLYQFSKKLAGLYSGIGMGYYIPSGSRAENAVSVFPLGYAKGNDLENSFGLNALAGFNFLPEKQFSVILELKYIYLETDMTTHMIGIDNDFDLKDRINLSTISGNLLIKFSL